MPKKDEKSKPVADRFLTINQRVEIIDAVESKKFNQRQMALKMEISEAAVSKIMKQKEEIRAQASQLRESDKDRSRYREPKYPLLDACLFNWYTAAREDKVRSQNSQTLPQSTTV